jgi:phage terminase large subunit-like protein
MTPNQIAEFVKCKRDCIYFIESYVKIEHQKRGVIPFKMHPFQKVIANKFVNGRWNITNKSRQTGISTITSAYALWLALFHKSKRILIVSITDQDAMIFLQKVKLAFDRLPDWMKDDPITDNAHELKLTSGSVVRSVASSKNAARGQSLSLLIVDECVGPDTKITVRNKKTGEIQNLSIEDFFVGAASYKDDQFHE